MLAGIEHDLDGIWGWRVALGVGGRVYSQPYEDQFVPLAEMALTWQPTERTTWHAALFRKIEDATEEGVGGYVATVGGVAMDHEINRHLILHLGADIERANYTDDTIQTIVTGRGGLLWLVDPRLRVNASMSLADHHGLTPEPFTEDMVLLSVTAGL